MERDPAGRLAATLDLDLLAIAEVVALHPGRGRAGGAGGGGASARRSPRRSRRWRRGSPPAGGCSTSAPAPARRIAALDAAELPPTYGTSPTLVQVIVAGGERALLQAVEGAEDDAEAGRCEVLERVRAGDAVVGIAASGTTPFTVAAVEEARQLGALTVGGDGAARLAAGRRGRARGGAETGAEVVMGSTRMKAGTAQKLVLNALSTAVMVRLGRVHSNLMVEMPATNAKLRAPRGARWWSSPPEVSPARRRAALAAAGGDVKAAVLVARGRGRSGGGGGGADRAPAATCAGRSPSGGPGGAARTASRTASSAWCTSPAKPRRTCSG